MNETDQVPTIPGKHPVATRRTLRAVAIFEAIKGIAALLAIVGLLNLMHHDARHFVEELIGRFKMDPGGHYPTIILHYADMLHGANTHLLVVVALAYVTLRMLEAYGLWYDRVWAEWLAALSGALYVPFELHHFIQRPSLINGGVLVANMVVVGFLAYQLWRHRRLTLNSETH